MFLFIEAVSRSPYRFQDLRILGIILDFFPDTVYVYHYCSTVSHIIIAPDFFEKLFLIINH